MKVSVFKKKPKMHYESDVLSLGCHQNDIFSMSFEGSCIHLCCCDVFGGGGGEWRAMSGGVTVTDTFPNKTHAGNGHENRRLPESDFGGTQYPIYLYI